MVVEEAHYFVVEDNIVAHIVYYSFADFIDKGMVDFIADNYLDAYLAEANSYKR